MTTSERFWHQNPIEEVLSRRLALGITHPRLLSHTRNVFTRANQLLQPPTQSSRCPTLDKAAISCLSRNAAQSVRSVIERLYN